MMKVFAVVLVAALVGLVAADEDVVTLTDDNFESTINDNEFVLVEFFAPWCGHCKKLAPEYAKAATALKADGIVLGAVDATENKDLATKFGVRGYPTLKVFKNGQAMEYKGGRTADTIVSYMRKTTGPPATELANAEAVTEFADSAKVVVVGYFSELSGEEYDAFIKVATADEDLSYGVTTDAEAAETAGTAAPSIVLFKKFDEGKNIYEGDLTSISTINTFVSKNKLPLVIPFTMEVAGEIFQSPIGKVAMLFTDDEFAGYSDIAEEFKGQFVFSTSDSSQGRLTSFLGIDKDDFPTFFIIEASQQMKKFPMQGDLTVDSIKAHLNAFTSGDLKPHYKSEDIPEENDGPVTVIVGKNFNDIVLDESKDVLLEVYAPWCGHCKKLAPIYEELGEAFADNANVVIAKMDGTANEIEGLNVRGFPTLKFYPAGKKTNGGEEYTGGRELEDFKTFLVENGKAKAAPSHEEL